MEAESKYRAPPTSLRVLVVDDESRRALVFARMDDDDANDEA